MGGTKTPHSKVRFDRRIWAHFHLAKVIHHARYIMFQIAEVTVPRELLAQILQRIWTLAPGTG